MTCRQPSAIPTSLHWEKSVYYGVVHDHASDCPVCDSYKDHRSKAALSLDPSFLAAASQQSACTGDVEMQNLREEINSLRTQLGVAQAKIDCPIIRPSEDNGDTGETELPEFANPPDTVPHRPSSALSDASFMTAAADIEEIETTGASDASMALSTVDSVRLRQPRPRQPIAVVHHNPPEQFSQNNIIRSPLGDISPDEKGWCVVGVTRLRVPKEKWHLDSLIKAANQPGNHDQVTFIKALVGEAMLTTDKSHLQRYLVKNWKTPVWKGGRGAAPTVSIAQPQRHDPPETWLAWYELHPQQFLMGVRRDVQSKLFLSDVRASRVIARLRPITVKGDQASRECQIQFDQLAIELFSTPHRYEQVLTTLESAIAKDAAPVAYDGPPTDVTLESVGRHFAACGISLETAEQELGPWLRERLRVSQAREQTTLERDQSVLNR